MSQQSLPNVPEGEVGLRVQQFINNDGATAVQCTKNADGTWTVTATLP